VAALVGLAEVDDVGVALLDPAAGGPEDLVRELGEADREGDVRRSLARCLTCGLGLSALPVRPGRRSAGARQPVQRDVVENVIPGEIARRLAVDKRVGDLVVAVRVVVEQPGRQREG